MNGICVWYENRRLTLDEAMGMMDSDDLRVVNDSDRDEEDEE